MKFKSNLKIAPNLIDLTPLVDVIFLMLIFFVVTSDTLPLKSLNIVNPTLDRAAAALTTQILVVADAHNVIYVGTKKDIVDLSSLKNQLVAEISLHQNQHPEMQPTVVLSVDHRVEYGLFLQIFSIVQQCTPYMRLVYKPMDLEA